jgi:hypothetical protein
LKTFWTVAGICTAVGGIFGAIAYGPKVVGVVTAGYKKTIGKKRALYDVLAKLAAGVQQPYFETQLGLPAAFRFPAKGGSLIETVYVHKYFYVSTLTDQGGQVLLYAVTVRDPKFKPPIWPHNLHPNNHPRPPNTPLGSFAFTDIDYRPTGIRGFLGANRYGYVEAFYFGNPANYQYYLLAINDAAASDAPLHDLTKIMPKYFVVLGDFKPSEGEPEDGTAVGGWETLERYLEQRPVQSFRSAAKPNTYAVSAPHFGPGSDGFPTQVGPDYGRVRIVR